MPVAERGSAPAARGVPHRAVAGRAMAAARDDSPKGLSARGTVTSVGMSGQRAVAGQGAGLGGGSKYPGQVNASWTSGPEDPSGERKCL